MCGLYVPFMLAGSILMAIGVGLMSTFKASTSCGVYIGYRILASAGIVLGFDGPQLAAQTVFQQADVPLALSIITSLMNLGGAIFVSVGSCILNGRVATLLQQSLPNLPTDLAQQAGLTDLMSTLGPQKKTTIYCCFPDGVLRRHIFCNCCGCAFICYCSWHGVEEYERQGFTQRRLGDQGRRCRRTYRRWD